MKKFTVKIIAIILVVFTLFSCISCDTSAPSINSNTPTNNPTTQPQPGYTPPKNDANTQEPQSSVQEFDFLNAPLSSNASQDHIRFLIENDLQEMYPDYYVDYVDCIYLSQEYIEELSYNSLTNEYFGYDYDEIASYMQGEKWTFTVDENGETIVKAVDNPNEALAKIVKKVAIGSGVIIVCAVLSPVAAYAGAAPVACFFAGAAVGALKGAVAGAITSAIIGGTISGITTKSWDGALEGAAEAAADGFMWGAIGGVISGGLTSGFCFTADTLVKTTTGYAPISEIKEGDLVYSYDESTNTYEYRPVSHVLVNTVTEIYNISINSETISTTAAHPFYTPDGWVKAEELHPGSKLLTNAGFEEINDILVTIEDEVEVFNLTVVHTHTYTVGLQDIVVHNDCRDTAKNARMLRNNMLDAGDVMPNYDCAAHHIVASTHTNTKAIMCRDILSKYGIDINSACNGVFLPTNKAIATTATYHRSVHTATYFDKVYSILSQANSADEVVGALKYIKTALLMK